MEERATNGAFGKNEGGRSGCGQMDQTGQTNVDCGVVKEADQMTDALSRACWTEPKSPGGSLAFLTTAATIPDESGLVKANVCVDSCWTLIGSYTASHRFDLDCFHFTNSGDWTFSALD